MCYLSFKEHIPKTQNDFIRGNHWRFRAKKHSHSNQLSRLFTPFRRVKAIQDRRLQSNKANARRYSIEQRLSQKALVNIFKSREKKHSFQEIQQSFRRIWWRVQTYNWLYQKRVQLCSWSSYLNALFSGQKPVTSYYSSNKINDLKKWTNNKNIFLGFSNITFLDQDGSWPNQHRGSLRHHSERR